MLQVLKPFMKWWISLLPLLFLFGCEEKSNNAPNENKVKEINLLLDENQLKEISNNPWENIYIPVKVVIPSTKDTVKGRLRIRGDSSRGYGKKSFKLKFDKRVKYFNDRKEINLNSAWTDKTYLREYATSRIFEAFEVPSPHIEHIFIYINGNPFGLYMEIENVDNDFLKLRNLDSRGYLYKAKKDGAFLSTSENIYEKWFKVNHRKETWQDLQNLINQIDTIPIDRFDKFLKKTFDYNSLISLVAINILAQNGSTYYHNYFLYHDIWKSGKWYFIPWDMDKTMSYYNWMPYRFYAAYRNNPLIMKILLNKNTFEDVKNKINDVLAFYFNGQVLGNILKKEADLIEKYIPLDTTDQIKDLKEWKHFVDNEINFVRERNIRWKKELDNALPMFTVKQTKHTCIKPPVLQWNRVKGVDNITYTVIIGKEHQLKEKGKTWIMGTTKDTFFVLPDTLKEGFYYWRIVAKDDIGREMWGMGIEKHFTYKKPYIIDHDLEGKIFTFIPEESPYLITKTLNFTNCEVLGSPNVEIYMKDGASIFFVNSKVKMQGDAHNPIYILPLNHHFDLWEFDYCKVNLSNINLSNGKITYHKSNLTIENSTFNITNNCLGHNSSMIWGQDGIVTIQNCFFYSANDSLGEGINLVRTKANIISNKVVNIPDNIELINSKNGIVTYNIACFSGDDGIDFNSCDSIIIAHNYLFANHDKGISIGTEQYGPSPFIHTLHNTIVGNKTGMAAKDSSCIKDDSSIIAMNKVALKAYLKNNYKHYSHGGCVISNYSLFVDNNKMYEKDKHSKIELNKGEVIDKNNIKVLSGFVFDKNYIFGAKPISVKQRIFNENKYLIIENAFYQPILLSDFEIKCGSKTNIKLPHIYLHKGQKLILTADVKILPDTLKKYPKKYLIVKHKKTKKCKKLHTLHIKIK